MTTLHARVPFNLLLPIGVTGVALLAAAAAVDLQPLLPAVLPLLAAGWLAWAAATPRRIAISTVQLTVTRILGRQTFDAAQIRDVQLRRWGLLLITSTGRHPIASLDAPFNAQVVNAAQRLLPQPAEARRSWINAGLPLIVRERRANLVLAWIGVVGLLLFAAAIQQRAGAAGPDGLALLFGLSALLLGFALLRWYPLAVHFAAAGMTELTALQRRHTALPQLRRIEVRRLPRTVRHITRQIALLRFHRADGRTIDWLPFEAAFPIDYVDDELLPLVDDIAARLRIGYLNPTD
jgi:hypothetical protein